jgi:multiple sugar transport system ATP-binding protein
MASVTIRNIHKAYGSVPVLHGVDIDMADGEFVVLVGPSGCGKSTLLRMIAGLEEITAGDILIGDKVVNSLPPKDRDIAMVFQNYALYPHMSVLRNMGFSMEIRRAAGDLIGKAVDRAATILGLSELLRRLPRELSGGQRQRVAMGRAIVRQPQVFLFDEPLSNLDAKLRVQMRTEIKALHQDLRTTAVYVTHDQVEAMTMADRIVVMHDGLIQQIGGPLDIYDQPANRFVAGFIGSPAMNFFDGVVQRENGAATVRTPDGHTLPLPPAIGASDGQAVTYGVRPESLSIDETAENGIPVTVEVIEPTGLSTLVFARMGGQPASALTMDRPVLTRGQPIGLVPDLDKVHLFDAQSGARV